MSQTESKVPFFARYLEGQAYPAVQSDLKAGKASNPRLTFVTLKYPSDNEEGPPLTTLKFPSDQEG